MFVYYRINVHFMFLLGAKSKTGNGSEQKMRQASARRTTLPSYFSRKTFFVCSTFSSQPLDKLSPSRLSKTSSGMKAVISSIGR